MSTVKRLPRPEDEAQTKRWTGSIIAVLVARKYVPDLLETHPEVVVRQLAPVPDWLMAAWAPLTRVDRANRIAWLIRYYAHPAGLGAAGKLWKFVEAEVEARKKEFT